MPGLAPGIPVFSSPAFLCRFSCPGFFARFHGPAGDDGRKRVAPATAPIAGDGFDAAMERAVGDLFRSFNGASPQVGLYHRVLHDLEAPLIAATLTWTRGNQIKAAEILGLNRNTLRKKIRDLNLRGVSSFR